MSLADLRDFLLAGFSNHELYYWLIFAEWSKGIAGALPSTDVPSEQFVSETILALARRNMIGEDLFSDLQLLRPNKRPEIEQVMGGLSPHTGNPRQRFDVEAYPLSEDREHRAIESLRTGTYDEKRRAIELLERSQNPWVMYELRPFVLGEDAELATAAVGVLYRMKIPPAISLAFLGLTSRLPRVRHITVYHIGELALFKDRNLAARSLPELRKTFLSSEAGDGVRKEIVHTMSKIGGDDVVEFLLSILRSPVTSAQEKAFALHGPTRFWRRRPMDSPSMRWDPSSRNDLEPLRRFMEGAISIVSAWDQPIKTAVLEESISKYFDDGILALFR